MSSSLFLVRLSWFLNSIFCLIWKAGGCVFIWSLTSLNDLWPSKLLCSSPLPGRPARHCRRDLGSRVRGAARLLPASAQRHLSGLIWLRSKFTFWFGPIMCSWPLWLDYFEYPKYCSLVKNLNCLISCSICLFSSYFRFCLFSSYFRFQKRKFRVFLFLVRLAWFLNSILSYVWKYDISL